MAEVLGAMSQEWGSKVRLRGKGNTGFKKQIKKGIEWVKEGKRKWYGGRRWDK